MNKLSFSDGEFPKPEAFRQELSIREIDWIAPEDLAVVDLIELYLEISGAFSMDHGVVVQFLAASAGPGSTEVALDMAWVASGFLGKKILVLNCTQSDWAPAASIKSTVLHDGTVHPVSIHRDLVKVIGRDMYLTDWRSWSGWQGPPVNVAEIHSHLRSLCAYFEMIVVVAPSADSEPLGAVLARYVDGNIIIIEAEQTRRSSAVRLREVLSRCGKPTLGAILHDRQNHIPRWMGSVL
jgi:hypothetical protein